jgi:DNA-binding MarR family transcriptional regulator
MRLGRSPFLKLLLLVNLTARPFARRYEKQHRLALSEWRVILVLAESPGLSSAEIAERLGLDKMAVSRAVRGLERRGRLGRRVDPRDGRRWALHLSAAGRALFRKIAPSAIVREAALFGVLTAAERARLEAILDRLVASARRLP